MFQPAASVSLRMPYALQMAAVISKSTVTATGNIPTIIYFSLTAAALVPSGAQLVVA
jgi:hypothetical protein